MATQNTTSRTLTPEETLGIYQANDAPFWPDGSAAENLSAFAANAQNAGDPGNGFPPVAPTDTTTSSGGKKNYYTAAQLPSATSQADYLNAMYDANEQRQRAALQAEYDANVHALDQQAAKVPGQYQVAANQAAAQAAVNQAAFNERAAAGGINSGAGSQAALAQNNALLSSIASIRKAQSDALTDVENQRTALQRQYQAAIAQAVANNEAERAQALYAEAQRVDESIVNTAINQASENYRAWQARYG